MATSSTTTLQISKRLTFAAEMRKARSKLKKPLRIDGSKLEGGGQLVRNSICLAALTCTPIEIHSVRANRRGGGGLKPQHLACVKWLAHASRARVQGASKGSKTLIFEPEGADGIAEHIAYSPAFKKVIKDGELWYECNLSMDTAGSTGLALQAILPFILFSELPTPVPIRLTLTGGTNVSGSPSYEYVTQVLLPTLHNLGFPEISAQLHRRGWTHGNVQIGSFTLEIPPREQITLPAFQLSSPLSEVADRARRRPIALRATFVGPEACHPQLRLYLPSVVEHIFGIDLGVSITCEASGHDKRMYLILVATVPSNPPAVRNDTTDPSTPPSTAILARDWLYDRKIVSFELATMELVDRVTKDLAAEVTSGVSADAHMRDQLVIFQALAQGKSIVTPGTDSEGNTRQASLHAQTAAWVAETMLHVTFEQDCACDGIGFGKVAKNDVSVVLRESGLEQRLEKLNMG